MRTPHTLAAPRSAVSRLTYALVMRDADCAPGPLPAGAPRFWWFYLYVQLGLIVFSFFGMASIHLAPSVPVATNGGSLFLLVSGRPVAAASLSTRRPSGPLWARWHRSTGLS